MSSDPSPGCGFPRLYLPSRAGTGPGCILRERGGSRGGTPVDIDGRRTRRPSMTEDDDEHFETPSARLWTARQVELSLVLVPLLAAEEAASLDFVAQR